MVTPHFECRSAVRGGPGTQLRFSPEMSLRLLSRLIKNGKKRPVSGQPIFPAGFDMSLAIGIADREGFIEAKEQTWHSPWLALTLAGSGCCLRIQEPRIPLAPARMASRSILISQRASVAFPTQIVSKSLGTRNRSLQPVIEKAPLECLSCAGQNLSCPEKIVTMGEFRHPDSTEATRK
jgi:hypothetical protein